MILSAIFFAASAVAFLSQGLRRATLLGAAASSSVCIAELVTACGWVEGLVIACVLAMTAASVLVLLLPPRPELVRPLAVTCALLGAVASGVGALGAGP